MPIGTSLGIDLSTTLVQGTTDPWGTALNTVLQTIIDAVEAKVTTSGININADLEFNGFRLTEVKSTKMEAQGSSLTGASNALSSWSDSAGNFYFTNGSGTAVQITSGGTVNVGSVGSIVDTSGGGGLGAYGSGGRQLEWDGTYYIFKDGTGGANFGQLKVDNVLVADEATTRFVTISAPSLGANYTLTLPTAVPGSTSLITMDSGGATATTRTPSIDTLTTSSTITASGLVTANAGVTAAANQHITVSGTGRFKHGNMERHLDIISGATDSANITAGGSNYGVTFNTLADSGIYYIPVGLSVGHRIVDLYIFVDSLTAGSTGTITFQLIRQDATPTENVNQTIWTTSGGTDQNSGTVAVGHTLLTDNTYFIKCEVSASWDRSFKLKYIKMNYDLP